MKRPSTGSGRPEPVEGRISHTTTDTLILSRASRVTNEERSGGSGLQQKPT